MSVGGNRETLKESKIIGAFHSAISSPYSCFQSVGGKARVCFESSGSVTLFGGEGNEAGILWSHLVPSNAAKSDGESSWIVTTQGDIQFMRNGEVAWSLIKSTAPAFVLTATPTLPVRIMVVDEGAMVAVDADDVVVWHLGNSPDSSTSSSHHTRSRAHSRHHHRAYPEQSVIHGGSTITMNQTGLLSYTNDNGVTLWYVEGAAYGAGPYTLLVSNAGQLQIWNPKSLLWSSNWTIQLTGAFASNPVNFSLKGFGDRFSIVATINSNNGPTSMSVFDIGPYILAPITPTSLTYPNACFFSPSMTYSMCFRSNGQAVFSDPQGYPIWTFDGSSYNQLMSWVLNDDGSLSLNYDHKKYWSTRVELRQQQATGASAVVTDDGVFVIRGISASTFDSQILWQLGSSPLYPNSMFYADYCFYSPNHVASLCLYSNGILSVAMKNKTTVIVVQVVTSHDRLALTILPSGNIAIVQNYGSMILWQSNWARCAPLSGQNAFIVVGDDGSFGVQSVTNVWRRNLFSNASSCTFPWLDDNNNVLVDVFMPAIRPQVRVQFKSISYS